MKRALILFVALLLFAGCPGQKHVASGPSIESFSLESQAHSLSKNYSAFIQLSKSEGFAGRIALYDNGNPAGELPLNGTENQTLFSLGWTASTVGSHTLEAALEDENGSEVSVRKSLDAEVDPIGNWEVASVANPNTPVDETIWCAQKFTVDNPVRLSQADSRLSSLIPTREGKIAILEIHNGTAAFPGENDTLMESAAIPSRGVASKAGWYSFQLAGKIYPAGEYWILLRRDDSVGNLAWEYTEAGGGSMCSGISSQEVWEAHTGGFLFKIS